MILKNHDDQKQTFQNTDLDPKHNEVQIKSNRKLFAAYID